MGRVIDRSIDERGNRYGKLVVLNRAGRHKHGEALWRCICDCGNETAVIGSKLRFENTKSCGCTTKFPLGQAAFNHLYRVYKTRAKKQQRKWELTTEQVRKITSSSCYYCGILPSQKMFCEHYNGSYTYNGMDRVDNKGGYVLDNVVACCGDCNMAKRKKSKEEFFEWIRRVYMYSLKEI